MGLVRMGPPEELVLLIRDRYSVDTFVETGTYFGNTAFWASNEFKRVITIERSETMFKQAHQTYGHVKNIEFIQGDSAEQLALLIPKLMEPTIFWLDSHWSGGETFGKDDECPLLQELEMFQTAHCKHVLIIDDARLFCSPPPAPHKKEQWPTLMQVMESLKLTLGNPYIVLFEDVFVCVPREMEEMIASYCQARNTEQWQLKGKLMNETPSNKTAGRFSTISKEHNKKNITEKSPRFVPQLYGSRNSCKATSAC